MVPRARLCAVKRRVTSWEARSRWRREKRASMPAPMSRARSQVKEIRRRARTLRVCSVDWASWPLVPRAETVSLEDAGTLLRIEQIWAGGDFEGAAWARDRVLAAVAFETHYPGPRTNCRNLPSSSG